MNVNNTAKKYDIYIYKNLFLHQQNFNRKIHYLIFYFLIKQQKNCWKTILLKRIKRFNLWLGDKNFYRIKIYY